MIPQRKTALILGKLIVSAGLIYWILRGLSFVKVAAALQGARPGLLVAAFLLVFVGYFITALRWRILLRVQGVDAPIAYLIRSFMVAIFFNNFLPSTIGGDVVRAYDSWRLSGSKTRAVSVIFIDRLFGLLVLMLFAITAAMMSEMVLARIPAMRLWLTLGLLGLVTLVGMVFYADRLSARILARLGDAPVGLLRKMAAKTIEAIRMFHGRHDVVSRALILSLLLQANVIFHFYLIATALGLPVPLYAFFLIIPVAIVIMMLPVSINGIGVREGIFVFLLAQYGVGQAQAIAFAWISFGFIVLQGMIGGVVYALRR